MTGDRAPQPGRRGPSRRQFLFGGAVAGIGAAAAIGTELALNNPAPQDSAATALNGAATVPFYGVHQAGIDTAPQAHAMFIALDLLETVDRAGLIRMMKIVTDDAARLTQGESALADSEPELAAVPARLTVTFGFGPGLVARANSNASPSWLRPLPAFAIDQLDPAYSDGDLLIQVAADDVVTVAHAARMLLKDTRSFATVRWSQTGFRRAYGSEPTGTTMRNLFGQVDGTTNPALGSDELAQVVWAESGWLTGGTSVVMRRIHMNLDKWDRLDRGGREESVGRTLSNGAPLTGTLERDEPDFTATTRIGFPVIPEFSHMRRARSDTPGEKIFRRGYNYDDAPATGQISNSGLVFVSFQADIDRQFVPIQKRLDDLDLLNEWTTPVGSAVFAIPPGCATGGYIGETLLS